MPGDPRMRASDADRDRAATLLAKHHAAGRLNSAEFGERMEQAMDAATLGELDELMADLPAIDIYDLPDAGLRRRPVQYPSQSLLPADPDDSYGALPGAGVGAQVVAGLGDGLSAGATAVAAWATVATALVLIGLVTAIVIGALVPIWAFVVIPVGGIFWWWFLSRRSRR